MSYVSIYQSAIGVIELRSEDGRVLDSLRFVDGGQPSGAAEVFEQAARWLDDYFNGVVNDRIPPISPHGTDFQKRVWRELLQVSRGSVITYGELSRRLNIRSAQAVGQAVKRNPIAIIIPCHRVVAATHLGGYAYGLNRKTALLALER